MSLCQAADLDIRHARTCHWEGAQVDWHQNLVHAVSKVLKRLMVPHQVESGASLRVERDLRMDMDMQPGEVEGRQCSGIPLQGHHVGCDISRPINAGTPTQW